MTRQQPGQAAHRPQRDFASLQPQMGDALLIIDLQNDFLPGGALAVPDGDAVIAPLNAWIERFSGAGLPILATRDRHPPDHCSFLEQGGSWPTHCVAGTAGAMITAALALPPRMFRRAGPAIQGALVLGLVAMCTAIAAWYCTRRMARCVPATPPEV